MQEEKGFDFSVISINGRFAYGIMCAERYALAKYPEKDWKRVFGLMWEGTNQYIENWYYWFNHINPEILYDYESYEFAKEVPGLSKEDYDYILKFFGNVDENMCVLIRIPAEILFKYWCEVIPGVGKETIEMVEVAIKILEDNNIELPDPQQIAFSTFDQRHGWGYFFDGRGRRLSIILND